MRALMLVSLLVWAGAAAAQTQAPLDSANSAPVHHTQKTTPPQKTTPSKTGAKATAKNVTKTTTKTTTKTITRTTSQTATKIPAKTPGKTTTRVAVKTVSVRKAPVVAPRHSGQVRRPVHPTVAVAAPPKAVAKPVPKPGVTAAAVVKPELPANVGPVTHLPLPRYVGLKSDEVNMRSGPGMRYPVLWTYKRRDLPMRVEREFDVWRLVEDMDGIKGWVQQNTLTGKRNFVVTGTEPRTLRAEADANSDAVAVLKPGVVGRVRSCDAGAAWCQVQVAGYRGWLERDSFWGTDSGEAVQP